MVRDGRGHRRGRATRGGSEHAFALNGDHRHSEMLAEQGLRLLDPERDPVRYARVLVRRGRSRWRLNQAGAATEDLERALALLPGRDQR